MFCSLLEKYDSSIEVRKIISGCVPALAIDRIKIVANLFKIQLLHPAERKLSVFRAEIGQTAMINPIFYTSGNVEWII